MESGSYFFTFFTPERVCYLARFFDFHLKGIENDWLDEPRVEVAVRSVDDKVSKVIEGTDWPLANVRWERHYVDLGTRALAAHASEAVVAVEYVPGDGEIVLMTDTLAEDMILAGPLSARLWLSCETEDTDIFLTFRVIAPDGKDISFFAATDPCAAPTQGWLRASQRKLDPRRSSEYQPVHSHDERHPLTPGEAYDVEVSIWPTSVQIPAGHRIALVIGGTDFAWSPEAGKQDATVRMVHDDTQDRPPSIFRGKVTLHAGGQFPSYLALPTIRT